MTIPSERSMGLPPASPPANEGHTVAAWVTVAVIIIGAAISCLAVIGSSVVGFWVGIGVIVLGLVVGRVLKMLGLGQPAPHA